MISKSNCFLAISFLQLGIFGCPSGLENPDRFSDGGGIKSDSASTDSGGTSTCGDVETAILAVKCGSAGCHASGGVPPDLKSPGMKARLLGANAAGTCSGKGVYIVSGNPTGGILYDKMQSSPSCGGSSMRRFGANPATEQEAKCIEQWIADVASGR